MSIINQNVFLIGPMGSGKTSIGKHLAKILQLDFYDCDHEIERITGASINLIFDVEGEQGFRLRENRMLKQLSSKSGILVATGGGVVCDGENRRLLRSKGLVVYLKTSIEDQLKRLSQAKNRPLLQAPDKMQRLRDLAHARNALYDETADLVFNTCSLSVYQSAKALSKIILEQVDPLKPEKPDADR